MTELPPGFPEKHEVAKAQAKRLRTALTPHLTVAHGHALELIAHTHGAQSWGHLNSILDGISAANGAQAPAATLPKPGNPPIPTPANRLAETHTDQTVLRALWEAIQTAKPTTVSPKAKAKAKELIAEGVIGGIAFENWLDCLDGRLGGMAFNIGFDRLIELCGVQSVSRYSQPEPGETSVYGSKGVHLAGFANALIFLSRLGLDTHPEPFVDAVLPAIKKAKHIDDDEMTCLWFHQDRENFKVSLHFIDQEMKPVNLVSEKKQMNNGTVIRIVRNNDELGLIHSLNASR